MGSLSSRTPSMSKMTIFFMGFSGGLGGSGGGLGFRVIDRHVRTGGLGEAVFIRQVLAHPKAHVVAAQVRPDLAVKEPVLQVVPIHHVGTGGGEGDEIAEQPGEKESAMDAGV